RFGVAAVHQRRRQCPVVDGEVEYQPVETRGRHPWGDFAGQHVETRGNELARPAHHREGIGAVDFDLSRLAQWCLRGVHISHASIAAAPRPRPQAADFTAINLSTLNALTRTRAPAQSTLD